MKILAYSFLLLWAAFSLGACTPAKKARKYDYLTKDSRPTTSTTPEKKPAPNNRQELGIVVNTAKSYVGTPYKYGGMSRNGMDCSGLVYTSYQAIEKQVPRTAALMAESGKSVNRNQLREGDLVFFNAKDKGNKINHVGMVVSVSRDEVLFVHSTTSRGVRIDSLQSGYWSPRFRKAVRIMS